jgi:acyl-CoA reductase-like NAD-dependent aldehyde dehydrogenase
MTIATINPSSGETVKTFTPATDAEIDAALARAHDHFVDYRRTSFAERDQRGTVVRWSAAAVMRCSASPRASRSIPSRWSKR